MNDTSFGINNEGGLVFSYYHEDSDQLDGANVYNGQLSTLWINFRQAFVDEIQETYQNLRSNSILNYDELINQFIVQGSDKWSESIYNEDQDFKYVSMLRSDNDATNLPQVRGTGEEHFRYFVENRLNYCDSKWYAGDYPEDNAIVRIYTPVDAEGVPRTDLVISANADITVTPYSAMYAGVRYKANGTLYQERLEENETYTFEAPNEIFNDTETAIYGASQLSSLGDLAPLYLGYIDVGAATKLVELKIGDGTPGYLNSNLYHLAVGTNRLLKKIDIQNCAGPKFSQALVLSGCPNIEEVYAKGSSITGVDLPESGYLKILQLPETIANLTLKNQPYLEDLTIEGLTNLKTITIENTPVDTLSILSGATNVERVRLTNVDWHHEDASILYELINRDIGGIDENGVNTDTMWIDGKCHIEYLTGEQFNYLKSKYPYLEITYTTLESQLVYMTLENGEHDNWVESHRETIYNAGNGVDPVTNGTIPTPTKTSTVQYNFNYNGWSLTANGKADSNSLLNIVGNRIVYAAFEEEIRSYTVNFYNGTTLLETHTIEYDSDATYGGETPIHETLPDYMEFTGWKPEPTNIQGNTDCYAQWYDTREITDDWATIEAACLDGTATEKYAIGSYKPVEITHEDGTVETINMEVIGHNHDELTDGVNKWEQVTETTRIGLKSSALIVYDNKLHIIGGSYSRTRHYTWDGTTLTRLDDLPFTNAEGFYSATVYNGDIHAVYKINDVYGHYKYDGSSWSEVVDVSATFPNNMFSIYLFVCNNTLYAFGYGLQSTTQIYKYSDSSWSEVELLGQSIWGRSMISYDGYIYLNDKSSLKKWNEDGLITLSSAPWTNTQKLFVYEDSLCAYDRNTLYKLENDEWVSYDVPSSFDVTNWVNFGVIEYNNELHLVTYRDAGSGSIWKWSTAGWDAVDSMPFGASKIYTFEYENKIYCAYGANKVMEYNGYEWTEYATMPFVTKSIAMYNGELYVYYYTTDTMNEYYRKVYKYNGSEWSVAFDFPGTGMSPSMIVYDGKLHFIGGLYAAGGHYAWDGKELTNLTNTNTIYLSCCAAYVYNDELYILAYGNHYKYVDGDWSLISTMPYELYRYDDACSKIAVCGDEIYAVPNYQKFLMKYDGNKWTTMRSPNDVIGGYGITSFRNHIYIFGGEGQNVNVVHALRNPKATLTFFAKEAMDEPVQTGTHTNGYLGTNLKICVDNVFENLDDDVKNVIKPVHKYIAFNPSDLSIVSIEEKCWLASANEVGFTVGDRYPNGEGVPYGVFTDNASRIRSNVYWWTRSMNFLANNPSYYWTTVTKTGTLGNGSKDDKIVRIVFGFCI